MLRIGYVDIRNFNMTFSCIISPVNDRSGQFLSNFARDRSLLLKTPQNDFLIINCAN